MNQVRWLLSNQFFIFIFVEKFSTRGILLLLHFNFLLLQGRILQMFITVVFACVVSSPGNEVIYVNISNMLCFRFDIYIEII